MIAVGFAGIWSAVFVVMTPARLPATPAVASAGFRLDRLALRRGAVERGRPLAVDLWAEAVLAAGFAATWPTGCDPTAYYRRRLPAA